MQQKTIHFVSLGCPKNRVDTEVMLGVSDRDGFRVVGDPAEASIIVVNTCGFIDAAKKESIDTILSMGELKTKGACERLVVSGCLVQRYKDELAVELPEVDHFLGTSDMLKLHEVLRGYEHGSADETPDRMLVGNPADYVFRAADPRRASLKPHSRYVKIAEGCSRTCSFCAIPSMRGKQRSRPIEDIVLEVEQLVAEGAVEINLISQDTVSFGRDLPGRPTLAELVARLAEVRGVRWLRLFYLYPETLTEPLLALLAEHPVVLPYVDMPLQHASDAMLRRMRRGHGGPRLRRVVETLRTRIADLTFRTAFIVGHPGETDADFQELLDFISWAEFDSVGLFRYSAEEGTKSGEMSEVVSAGVAERRYRKAGSVQRVISKRRLRRFVGREIEVLVEGESDESEYLFEGRHAGQAPDIDGKVILANGTARSGELRRARVVAASDYDLVADLLPQAERDEPLLSEGAVNMKPQIRTRAGEFSSPPRRRSSLPVLK